MQVATSTYTSYFEISKSYLDYEDVDLLVLGDSMTCKAVLDCVWVS